MKKKNIFVCIGLILMLVLTIGLMYSKQNEKENLKSNTKGLISYYIEKEDNTYEKTARQSWLIEGYFLNEIKSSCENGSVLSWENNKVQVTGKVSDKCSIYFDKSVKNYDYTGTSQKFIASATGNFKIELWGASGGDIATYIGGKGAYTSGIIELNKNDEFYIYIGESGKGPNIEYNWNPTYNGGGGIGFRCSFSTPPATLTTSVNGASGGGTTDIRIIDGVWDDFNSLKSRIMVAAGGGGACRRGENNGDGNGGAGGTLIGIQGENVNNSALTYGYGIGYGGTQTSAGRTTWVKGSSTQAPNDENIIVGGFGYAGIIWGTDCDQSSCKPRNNVDWATYGNQCGGGGGYYGGGSNLHGGAGGGSSFISGYKGCVAIKEESTEDDIQLLDGCNDGTENVECSYHYSGRKFTDPQMIAGNSVMPNPDGGTEEGHVGNGYARITYLGK